MRTLLALAALLASAASASAQQREIWLVGGAQDGAGRHTLVDYVDAASITAPTPNTRRAWTWFFHAPYSSSEFAGEYGVSFREYNCTTRQMRFLQTTHYGADGSVLPSSSRASPWEYVTPETMGEFELDFVCAPAESRRGVRVNAAAAPRDHAAVLFASR